jgi:3-deoxy-D-manno-octulosonic-acid transferase
METEIWPNLFAYCGNHNIPLYIVNARIAEKSVKNYKRLSAFIRPALAYVSLIATQTEDDKNYFIAIGSDSARVKNMGNIKFDVEISEDMIKQGLQIKADLFKNRFVWLVASTHKDEEQIFLDLYPLLKAKIPELLLVLVPRHQQRFTEVTKLCTPQLKTVVRTAHTELDNDTELYLVDTIGELKMFYATADIAFVGGSMVKAGGHNILEAAAVGVPVLFGSYIYNFKAIADGILKHQAAIQCQTGEDVIEAVLTLYQQTDYRDELIARGKTFIQSNQGTVTRICEVLEAAL